jgi:hypothetical protein
MRLRAMDEALNWLRNNEVKFSDVDAELRAPPLISGVRCRRSTCLLLKKKKATDDAMSWLGATTTPIWTTLTLRPLRRLETLLVLTMPGMTLFRRKRPAL